MATQEHDIGAELARQHARNVEALQDELRQRITALSPAQAHIALLHLTQQGPAARQALDAALSFAGSHR